MKWDGKIVKNLNWAGEIKNLQSKEAIAKKIAREVKSGEIIGFGSGSTSYLALIAIGARIKSEHLNIKAIPTSYEVELACIQHGIPTVSFLAQPPDWYFDGADEIDPEQNLIKGRGGAMLKEKLIMTAAKKTFILADQSKFVNQLGEHFPVPVEVIPLALSAVESRLMKLGASEIQLRLAVKKDGPVITENGNFILDVKFSEIFSDLEKKIKLIPGVLDSGLFWGYEMEVVKA